MANVITLLHAAEDCCKVLECPTCKDYMSAPISQCLTGHSICTSCKDKSENCPICQNQFSATRNFALEHLLEGMKFPCENSEYGCKDSLILNKKADHEKTCPYRLYECLSRKDGCMWHGRKADILSHVQKEHNTRVWVLNGKFPLVTRNFHFNSDSPNTKLISAHGEIFWYKSFIDKAKKTFYISVHYIGPQEDCLKYYYRVNFTSLNSSKHKIIFMTNTRPDHILLSDLINDRSGCFSIEEGMAKNFIEGGILKYSIEIIKVVENDNLPARPPIKFSCSCCILMLIVYIIIFILIFLDVFYKYM